MMITARNVFVHRATAVISTSTSFGLAFHMPIVVS